MSAVDYARHVPDVSVVSMSWGGSEFWSQTSYDQYFTTPAGHQGVTFVAASGDSGSWWGPSWPASSPNVLAVGGTTLDIASDGTSETGWYGSGGGISRVESTPSYQQGVQGTGGRTSPDVSFNADPRTGFAVYDSMSYQGSSGWTVIGGTSAGAPQWAALVAVANQERVSNGLGTLDGSTGTLPMLYALYHDPAAYAANFNDVTLGRSYYSSHVGYDGVTGLGTPKADQVVLSLSGASSSAAAPAPVIKTTKAVSVTRTVRRTHTAHVRRTITAVAPTPAPVETIPFSLAPAISSLSLAGNRDVLSPIGGPSTAALTGGFASASSIFTSTFFARTSAGLLVGTFSHRPVVRLPLMVASAGESAPAVATGDHDIAAPASNPMTPAIPPVAEATPRIFKFARIDWFNAFADAWGALADESASLVVRNNVKRIRAWTITAAVAAADVMLLSYWYAKRRKAKQRAAGVGMGGSAEEA
jgi:hypothetical protein